MMDELKEAIAALPPEAISEAIEAIRDIAAFHKARNEARALPQRTKTVDIEAVIVTQ